MATVTQNNALVVQPDEAIAGSYGGCNIDNLPVGSNMTVSVEISDIIIASNAWTQVILYSGTNQWQIKASGDGSLRFQNAASQDLGSFVAYQPSYRWWRFRNTSNTLFAEYFDGSIWNGLGSPQNVSTASTISVEINAGINNAAPYAGTGRFQTVVVCP